MDMIAIDPKLFITCRLCLDEMGMYQIVPKVQEQIKYCFDIDVDPFDSLPQLICRKCQTILSEYYITKSNFIVKQNDLKKKLEVPVETIQVFPVENKSYLPKDIDNITYDSPQQETVSSSQQNDNEQTTTSFVQSRCRSLSSSSASDNLFVKSSTTFQPKRLKRCRNQPRSWEEYYHKQYGCRMCSKKCRNRGNLANHIKCHEILKRRHNDVLKTNCKVILQKIDDHPNITGKPNTVMHSKDRIIGDGDNNDYFVLYTAKESKERAISITSTADVFDLTKSQLSHNDSSDDDDFLIKRTKRKRRLLSQSSKETVVLDGDDKNSISSDNGNDSNVAESKTPVSNEIDCINIDDSSDSESCNSNIELNGESTDKSNSTEPEFIDHKTVNSIILMCFNKYLKRKKTNVPVNLESLLKHKILSMGRKILIPNRHVNCTGLLRYMEYKNLNIKWISTKNDTVRIMPKLLAKTEPSGGWKNTPDDSVSTPFKINKDNPKTSKNETIKKHTNVGESTDLFANNIVPPVCDTSLNSVSISEPLNGNSKTNKLLPKTDVHSKDVKALPLLDVHSMDITPLPKPDDHSKDIKLISKSDGHSKENKPLHKPAGSAVLYSYMIYPDSDMRLLNASPVANPKQLPKKMNLSEVKTNIKSLVDTVVLQSIQPSESRLNESICIDDEEDVADTNVCMPIITSTTSLAIDATNQNKQQIYEKNPIGNIVTNESKESEKSAPRIKVKPASELMSQQALDNLNQQPSAVPMWNLNQSVAVSESQNMAKEAQFRLGPPMKSIELTTPSSSIPREQITYVPAVPGIPRQCAMMHTAELPNTKTDSPYKYFKNLLFIHNIIILLEMNDNFVRNSVRLTKFKLQFDEASVEQSVELSLSLHCAGNEFCLEVKDCNQENVDLQILSASWQWEILKVFRGDIVNNVLKKAQKESQSVYEYTKSFLCLLKSINFEITT